jgi:hypothetical protein
MKVLLLNADFSNLKYTLMKSANAQLWTRVVHGATLCRPCGLRLASILPSPGPREVARLRFAWGGKRPNSAFADKAACQTL